MPVADQDLPKRTRGRPKLEEVEQIDRHVLRVAMQEFARSGYGGTSMRQIVKTAGVSKTTLYSRFASKAALFHALVHAQIVGIAVETVLCADGAGALERGLMAYAERTLQVSLAGDVLHLNRLVYSESSRFPELAAAAAERSALGISQIASFIRRCAEADRIPCSDPEGIAEAFIFMLRGWYVDVMLTNVAISPARRRQWVQRAVHALIAGRGDW